MNFEKGFNLLLGDNESGKTTLLNFILSVLYGFVSYNRSDLTKNERRRYRPWSGEGFGGYVELTHKNTSFRIDRTFGDTASKDQVNLINIESGESRAFSSKESPGEFLLGLKRDEFIRSVFVGQMATVMDKSDDIQEKLLAASAGAGTDVSLPKIKKDLEEQRKKIQPPRSPGALAKVEEELKELEEERALALTLASEISVQRQEIDRLNHILEEKRNQIELIKKEEKARQLETDLKDIVKIEKREKRIQSLADQINSHLGQLELADLSDLPKDATMEAVEDSLRHWEKLEEDIKIGQKHKAEITSEIKVLPNREELEKQKSKSINLQEKWKSFSQGYSTLEKMKQTEEKDFSKKISDQRVTLHQEQLSLQKKWSAEEEKIRNFEDRLKKIQDLRKNWQEASNNHKQAELDWDSEEKQFQSLVQQAEVQEKNKGEIEEQLISLLDETKIKEEEKNQLNSRFSKDQSKIEQKRDSELEDLRISTGLTDNESFSAFNGILIIGLALIVLATVLFVAIDLPSLLSLGLGLLGIILTGLGLWQRKKEKTLAFDTAYYIEKDEAIRADFEEEMAELQMVYIENLRPIELDLKRLDQKIDSKQNEVIRNENSILELEKQKQSQSARVDQAKEKLQDALDKEQAQAQAYQKLLQDEGLSGEITESVLHQLEKDLEERENNLETEKKGEQDVLDFKQKALEAKEFKLSTDCYAKQEDLEQLKPALIEPMKKFFPNFNPDISDKELADSDWQIEIQSLINRFERYLENHDVLSDSLTQAEENVMSLKMQLEKLLASEDTWIFSIQKASSSIQANEKYQAIKKAKTTIDALVNEYNFEKDERDKAIQDLELGNIQDLQLYKAKVQEDIKQIRPPSHLSYLYQTDEKLTVLRDQVSVEEKEYLANLVRIQEQLEQNISKTRILETIDKDLEKKRLEVAALQEALADLELAIELVDEVNKELQKSLGPVMNEKTSEILVALTGQEEEKLLIDRDFNVRLEDQGMKKLWEAEYSSAGKYDQIYLAMRLAIISILYDQDDDVKIPLIFDDSFVQYDSERSQAALRYLVSMAEKDSRQIIFSTCHRVYADTIDSEAHILEVS